MESTNEIIKPFDRYNQDLLDRVKNKKVGIYRILYNIEHYYSADAITVREMAIQIERLKGMLMMYEDIRSRSDAESCFEMAKSIHDYIMKTFPTAIWRSFDLEESEEECRRRYHD